ASLMAGEVVDARGDLGLLVGAPKQFDRGETVERVLQTTAAVERALPAVAIESAGLVVDDLERFRAHLYEPIHATGDVKRKSLAEIDLHRFGAREGLEIVFQRPPERDLEGDWRFCRV